MKKALLLCLLLLLTGCGKKAPTATLPPTTAAPTETMPAPPEEENAMLPQTNHPVVVYFASWRLGTTPLGEVAAIPWDSVSFINHAFWAVEPVENPEISSFDRRKSGSARTEWRIVSMSPENDERNHFPAYAALSEKYPDVNILISIGGWTRSGFFSEMAFTEEGRASFADCCLQLMEENPWIDGIDIDWEYPAGSRDGERTPDGADGDQGCPIFGTAAQDRENFALLLKQLRQAMDARFGAGVKKLTACSSGSVGWTLPCQDWKAASEYLDLINIMSYDLAGPWDGASGHASSASLSKSGAMYMKQQGIPLEKLCLGCPMYGSTMKLKEIRVHPVGVPIENYKPEPAGIHQSRLEEFEKEAASGYTYLWENGRVSMGEKFDTGSTGWHMEYDERNGAAYLYNDEESSPYYGWFISYENPLSLQNKADYILEKGIGGLIVWETTQDDGSHGLIPQMHDQLNP